MRVGLIGIGRAAQIEFLPVLTQLPGVAVHALHPSPERLAQLGRQWPLAGTATSLDGLLQVGIETAIVATPPATHAQYVLPLLAAGVDVLCEKPLALRLAEVEAMAEAAARTGRILMAGFNRRYTPVYVQAKAWVTEPDVVVAQKNKPRGEYRGLISDAVHVLDALRWFCGDEVAAVSAAGRWAEPLQEAAVTAQIRFGSGRIGLFAMHRHGGHWLEQLQAYGGGRTATVEYPDRLRLSEGERQELVEMTPRAWGWSPVHEVCGFAAELEHFFACVAGRSEPLTGVSDALKTHRLVDAIYRAAGLPGLE